MMNFNPRSPCGERLSDTGMETPSTVFQSTLPVRGATTPMIRPFAPSSISIHAPRAGSDRLCGSWSRRLCDFNPRSPCGERPVILTQILQISSFQSTLPVRGATLRICFSSQIFEISIHAPRAGSD